MQALTDVEALLRNIRNCKWIIRRDLARRHGILYIRGESKYDPIAEQQGWINFFVNSSLLQHEIKGGK